MMPYFQMERPDQRGRIRQSCAAAIIFLCTLSFGGCAAATLENVGEKEDAMKTYVRCLQDAATRLDDGTSDVSGVALAVKSMCASQFISSVQTYARGMSFDAYQALRNRLEAERLSDAAGAVMQARAARSRATPTRPKTNPASQSQAPSGELLKDAAAADQRDDDAIRFRIFHSLANRGDAKAQAYLGYIYDVGKGVAQNYAEAARWYRKAADQGHAQSQFVLGLMYARGLGVAKNDTEAAKWVRKAAVQGDANAQAAIGLIYVNGLGVSQDYSEAARWYRRAADQGNASAKSALADLYDRFPALREQQ